MSFIKKSNNILSSNDKVMHYLQNSTNNKMLEKLSTHNLFSNGPYRSRFTSENDSLSLSSLSSVLDSLSRSDGSPESSLSDPVAHCSITSSNLSSDEDLDFNIGFEQIYDDDDGQLVFNKNNADAITLLDDSSVDEHINRLSNSTNIYDDEYDVNNDEVLTDSYTKQRRSSFLYDSTNTLCSQDLFSAYTDDDDHETEPMGGLSLRSNSLSVLQIDDNSTFVETAPKKVVRFADTLGLDLESIRYMTPPDQSTTPLIQDCLRLQLGQLYFSKSPLPSKRSTSSTSLPSTKKQYNLVSKNFLSPINIIPLIYDKQVLLECLYTKDSTAYGTIRVHNCSYDKNVFVRLTDDEWKTSRDVQSWHSMNYPHDNTDAFNFEINLSKLSDGLTTPKRILFAVCLKSMEKEFWDSNQGQNYVLDVHERR